MNKKYPLIDLTISLEPSFWIYNNYAYVYQYYLESYKLNDKWEVMGEYQKKPLLDSSLEIEKIDNLYFIQNDTFIWVNEAYYGEGLPIESWHYSEYAINCFSANYELNESEAKGFINDEIFDIEVHDFKRAGLCPDSQELDLLVKDKLKNIDIEWTGEEIFSYVGMEGGYMPPSKIYAFFDFHFLDYEGDPNDFIIHSIELVSDIWGFKNVKNIKRKKCFDRWIEDIVKKYDSEITQLNLEPITKPKPQMNIRLSEEFTYLRGGLQNQFKLPYKFISADMYQIVDAIRKFYNEFFYTYGQVLVMNDAFTSKGFFMKGELPYTIHNTPKYFLKEFYITLEEREKINGTDEINEDDLIRVILKERLFIDINDNQDLTDEYIQSILLIEFDKKRDVFFEELSKLALEFLPQKLINIPEPPQIQNDLENKKLTLTGDKVAIYHVFKQLIAKKIIGENAKEVAEFLLKNVKGFENSDIANLATEITRDRETDLEKGRIGISKKNRIDLD